MIKAGPEFRRVNVRRYKARVAVRVELNQDLFAGSEDLAGIMDALRWKSLRRPLADNRNPAAEPGAAGRLRAKIGQPLAFCPPRWPELKAAIA